MQPGKEGMNEPQKLCANAWLQVISRLNTLTYVVDALRTFMLGGATTAFGLSQDYAVILLTTAILVLVGARLYPRLAA
jgi:ABC-2 type transport system permease protein